MDNATELLEKVRAGDEAALGALLVEVQPKLYRYSMKMCSQKEDAEDVMQESMLAMARSLRDFRGASSLSTWLFAIVRSFCIKKRRRRKFAPVREESFEELNSQDQDYFQSGVPDPYSQTASSEVWEQLLSAIRQIDLDYREVLILRDIEGLKAKEIAEIMGIGVSAVKSRLHRARAELRAHLSEHAVPNKSGCPDIQSLFSQHLEGDLSSNICQEMEAHVSQCLPCSQKCDGLKEVLKMCGNVPNDVPEDLKKKVQDTLRLAISQVSK